MRRRGNGRLFVVSAAATGPSGPGSRAASSARRGDEAEENGWRAAPYRPRGNGLARRRRVSCHMQSKYEVASKYVGMA